MGILNVLIVMKSMSIDNKLFKKYTNIWEKVSNLMNTEFDSEPVYDANDKYMKIKLRNIWR